MTSYTNVCQNGCPNTTLHHQYPFVVRDDDLLKYVFQLKVNLMGFPRFSLETLLFLMPTWILIKTLGENKAALKDLPR